MSVSSQIPPTCLEWHVSPKGRDQAVGTAVDPLRTIQEAARRAEPGDTIFIHAGTYRERVDPPRGGSSNTTRIVYCPAGDGPVEIKGSEVVDDWRAGSDGVWVAEVSNERFGEFNPYQRTISGHWFYPKERLHHPGAVYFDGHWLIEAASRDELVQAPEDARLWFAEGEGGTTRIWARFGGKNPADGLVEINVRETVFYPSREGCNFITVRGLTLLHAATPWAPPTTEQIGLIGSNWSKGWIIEDCVVRYSACAGITLGKYNDPEDFPDLPVVEYTDGRDTYHGTIHRAADHGWSLESVGNHVVRNTTVSHCEMAGICGSLGAVRSQIIGNTVHDIHVHRLFKGFEQAGIKFHGAIDTVIAGNRIFRCYRGIWLDWMSQGTRVSRNVCHDNGPAPDLFTEVNHGPFVVDGNFFLSDNSLRSQSDGGAYVGNVFRGRVEAVAEPNRITPYFHPHTTQIAGWKNVALDDDRYSDNLLAEKHGLSDYDRAEEGVAMQNNLFVRGARPSLFEKPPVERDAGEIVVEEKSGALILHGVLAGSTRRISADAWPPAKVSGAAFEDPDGRSLELEVTGLRVAPDGKMKIWPQESGYGG